MPSFKARQEEKELERRGPWRELKVYINALGPGLITGASDDDPSGIGAYSQTGAQFGCAQLCSGVAADTGCGAINGEKK